MYSVPGCLSELKDKSVNYVLIFDLEGSASQFMSCNQLFLSDKINLDQLPRARWGAIGKRDIKELFGGKNCSIF